MKFFMKTKLSVVSGLAGLACLLMTMGPVSATASEDWLYWSNYRVTYPINANHKLMVMPGVWFKNDMSDSYYRWLPVYHVGKWSKHWSSLAAIQYDETKKNGDWVDNQYLIFGPVYSHSMCDLISIMNQTCKFKAQARFFYRTNGDAAFDHWRPRLYLSHKLAGITWTLSDELRFDLTGDRPDTLYKNRIFFGGTKKLTQRLSLYLGYVRESNRKTTSGLMPTVLFLA